MKRLVHTEHDHSLVDSINGPVRHHRAFAVQTHRISRHIGGSSQIAELQMPVRMPRNIIIIDKFLIADSRVIHLGDAVPDKTYDVAVLEHALVLRHQPGQFFLNLQLRLFPMRRYFPARQEQRHAKQAQKIFLPFFHNLSISPATRSKV